MKIMRDFNTWLQSFKEVIAGYKYYTDFEKIYRNVDGIKVQLCLMNSLIGSPDIEKDFQELYAQYPEILRCIPILLAKRHRRRAPLQLQEAQLHRHPVRGIHARDRTVRAYWQ